MTARSAPPPGRFAPEAWMGSIAEATSAALFVFRDKLVWVNRACCELTGYSAAELLDMDPGDLLPPERRERLIDRAGDVLAGRIEADSYELEIVHKGGQRRWMELTSSVIELADGPAIVGTALDITDHMHRDLALRESEGWFRAMAETTSTAIFVYRQRFLYANPAFLELSGYGMQELLGMDPVEVVHPDFREAALLRKEARLKGETAPQRYEMLVLTRDGEERWVDYAAARITVEGEPAVLGTAIDITERKLAEIALRASEERLNLAQRAAGVVTWDWNLLTDELVVSDSVAHMIQIPGEGMPHTSAEFFRRAVHPADRQRVMEAVRRAIEAGHDYTVEHRLLLPEGEEIWLAERGQAIRDESGWVVRMLGVSIDITERKLAEIALRENSERLRLMMEQLPAILWTTDTNLVFTSSLGTALNGLGLRPNEVAGKAVADFLSGAEPTERALEAHRRALAGESVSFEQVFSGNTYQSHVEPLRDAEGEIVGCIGIALDVTERKRAEEALFRERERAQATLASIGDGVIRTDAASLIDFLNPVAERLTGFTAAEARGRRLDEIYRVVDEVSRKPLLNPVERCLRENRPVMLPGERLLVSRDGSEYTIRDSAAPIRDRDGRALGTVLAFKDVTAVRDMEREMTYLASHDGLTGLYNRTQFEHHLGRALEDAARRDHPFAVLQLDLSQLKVVNDTCGHLAGDELLKQVARLLAESSAEEDVVARLGADEFGVLLRGSSAEGARRKAERIRTAFQDFRFAWADRSFEVGVAIGLVPARGSESVGGLMIAVDTACLLAKESGRNRIHEYKADDEALAERYREMHWIHRIYKALEEDSFRLYCQPVRPLVASDEGLLGEVLLRMVDERGELVLPRTFIPTAERYRLISSIDRWVVSHSLERLAAGAQVGGQRLERLAINLSGESLAEESFLDFAVKHLETSGVAPQRIFFEITETAAIANLAGAMRFISELQDRGTRFILDDFGSGLSSFAYLKNLPVDYLKISGEFVRGVQDVPMHRTLVRSINQIGHELGLKTIAEGVESEEILHALEEIELDYAQGYWIAQPAPLELA